MFGTDKNERDVYLPETQNKTAGEAQSVLILTANKVEDLEFFYPYYRFIEAGYRVDVATPDGGTFAGKNGLELKSSRKIEDVNAADYALLYIPGGKAPAELKDNDRAVALVKTFVEIGKPVSAICHGPQMLAKAGVVQGKRIAGWPEIEDELKEAGAIYENKETVCDGLFITARWPGDLPSHMRHTLKALEDVKSGNRRAAA